MRDESIAELAALLGLPYRINHIPLKDAQGNKAPNRPGTKRPGLIPDKDTVHETANKNVGANAHMHEMYVRAPNWGGPQQTSYHHVVDDKEAIELLPWEEVAYHGGTPTSNREWMGCELCVNADGNWSKTQDNAARLFACKAVKFEKPVSWIVQHNAAYGKDCPATLRHTPGAWDTFRNTVSGYMITLTNILNPPAPSPISPLITVPAFQDFYLKEPRALELFGLPLEASKQEVLSDGNTYTVQYFERARFELHGDKVLLGLIGKELLNG